MKEIKTVSLKALMEMNVATMSKKSDMPRGIETVSTSDIIVGDKVVIGNYFTLVTE